MLLQCTAEYRILSRSLSFACCFASCHRSHFQPLDYFECTDKFSFIMAPADVRPPHVTRSPSTEQISASETYFLPDNPPPHLTPSLTHQPELLFTQSLLDSLANVVTQILNQRSSTGATSKPPPPSPSPTTSSEDPVLLMTNVPILKKARPGQPPHRLFSHLDPPSTTTVPPPALAPSLLHPQPVTTHPPPLPTHRHTQVRIPRPHCNGHITPFHFSHNILQFWTPMWTAYPPLRQHHHVQHLPQLTHHTAFHHHHNPLHLPYFHHSHHFQNFHSLINRPANLPPLSCGLRAVRLLQRLPTC